jgi:hypothetical protein
VATDSPAFAAGPEYWASLTFHQRATAWIDTQLAALGHARSGDLAQPHLRPWATALCASSSAGRVWLKATCPATSFEIAVYPLLQAVLPRRVLTPLARDAERGWLLLPDGGDVLEEALPEEAALAAFERILPQYAELQQALAPRADALVASGVADMRPSVMLERFDAATACVAPYLSSREGEEYARVLALRDTFAGRCRELAARPGAASLDHGDLHLRNVFVSGQGATLEARFYDWGDSVIAHPFACLLVPLAVLAARLKTTLEDPRVVRARDAYLEPFGALMSRVELVETVQLARWVARAARVLVWERAIADYGRSDPEFHDAPFQTLRRLLESA